MLNAIIVDAIIGVLHSVGSKPKRLGRITLNKTSPTFSIVIEWENARMTDVWRTREMLKQLHEQLIEVGQMQPEGHPQPKIFIPYDKNRIDPETIEMVVGEVSEIESWP